MNAALTQDTSNALARDPPEATHCRGALLVALVFYGVRGGRFVTHRNAVARLFWSLLEERKRYPIAANATTQLRRAPRFSIEVPQRLRQPAALPTLHCDCLMEVRAAFMTCGSLAAGSRGYHLEFAALDTARAQRLTAILRAVGSAPKRSRRRNRPVLYFKDFETIVDLLARVGAHGAVLALEDVRALRETKNRIHRLVNTEAANLERAAQAAAAQRRTIEYIERERGLRRLSAPLREIAMLRLRFPGESLVELGRRCRPPIGKPTVSSRLFALNRFAERLRQGQRDTAR
ncbi:MAG TPA: DNA-binding protein WhiA [Candidatus Tyrphobacter sp.]